MKKFALLSVALLLSFATWGQRQKTSLVLPGKGHLDVESFLRGIDLKQDISQLSLSELRILRNAFAARQGYAFESADLRHIFNQTSWYDSLLRVRYEKEYDLPGYGWNDNYDTYTRLPLTYSAAETAFIHRLKARENELRQQHWRNPAHSDWQVNVDNLINPWQVECLDDRLQSKLGKNGFAIVPGQKLQLFQVYENNDYHDFPNFVTTDLYLQLFHFYFDCVLRDIEEQCLAPRLSHFCRTMMAALDRSPQALNAKRTADRQWCKTYFAVALALNEGKDPQTEGILKSDFIDEMGKIKTSVDDFSSFLGYETVRFNYSLFRPRGHYTRSEISGRYFQSMMWLQTVPFGTDRPEQLRRVLLLAHLLGTDAEVKKAYDALFDPLTLLMGPPDNISLKQVYEIIQSEDFNKLIKNRRKCSKIAHFIEEKAKNQTRIIPKNLHTSRYKINLMPQRYQPDAEVLQEMVDYDSEPTLRDVPNGLDLWAAMGVTDAEDILINELKEAQKWPAYQTNLQRMKQRMNEVDWTQCFANQWLSALQTSCTDEPRAPFFMHGKAWQKKNLNAALASWAELKHDAILYAKQPMGAECGDGGMPPEPVLRSYVEPNVAFWTKAVALLERLETLLTAQQLMTERTKTVTASVKEQAQFLLRLSQKELENDGLLSDEEYKQLEIIGSTFEYLTLDLIRSDDNYIDGWYSVEGTDKSVAVVADVYTANADNNPNKSVLYAGVGPAYEIYVIVPLAGELYLMRGAVLSYREYKQSIDEQRLTDEEWQKKLKENPSLGMPSWMEDIMVPADDAPIDNETIFYSSGC